MPCGNQQTHNEDDNEDNDNEDFVLHIIPALRMTKRKKKFFLQRQHMILRVLAK